MTEKDMEDRNTHDLEGSRAVRAYDVWAYLFGTPTPTWKEWNDSERKYEFDADGWRRWVQSLNATDTSGSGSPSLNRSAMSKVLSYDDVLERLPQTKHLLLGNGFSIACDKIFNYPNLQF